MNMDLYLELNPVAF